MPSSSAPARSTGADNVLMITVVYSPGPRQVEEVALEVANGATVLDAVCASALLVRFPELAAAELSLGIWGQKAVPDQLVQAGNRVEIYRPLRVDPKMARRTRFEAQGARSAGLFARRRPGAKAGY